MIVVMADFEESEIGNQINGEHNDEFEQPVTCGMNTSLDKQEPDICSEGISISVL